MEFFEMTCEPYLTRFVSNIRYWFRLTWIIHVSTYGRISSIRKIYSIIENMASHKILREIPEPKSGNMKFNYTTKVARNSFLLACKNRWTIIVLICVHRILNNIWVKPHSQLRQTQFGSLLRRLSERPYHFVFNSKPLECRSITFQLAKC